MDFVAIDSWRALCSFMLSDVKEFALEVLRLVGAERDEERAGTAGGKSIVL